MIETTKTRKCDVFGTKKNVRNFRVKIEVLAEEEDALVIAGMAEAGTFVLTETPWTDADLGKRGHERLLRCIQRGLHPAGWKPEDDEAVVADSSTTGADPLEVGADEEIPSE